MTIAATEYKYVQLDDRNVPIQIKEGLRLRDVDVLTVQEDGLASFPDPAIFDRAIELKRLVFSEDQDFLAEAKHRQKAFKPVPIPSSRNFVSDFRYQLSTVN
jgi:predicted nuclease of predicted toxin-antitoxin system